MARKKKVEEVEVIVDKVDDLVKNKVLDDTGIVGDGCKIAEE